MKFIKDLGMQYPAENSPRKYRFGLYECPICNNIHRHMSNNILKMKACIRCVQKTHGFKYHKHYPKWKNQKYRCNNIKCKVYSQYGGRGITFSNEFLDFKVWLDYIETLDNYEKPKHTTLDRIDNNGHYERGNLRWATMNTQAQNKRKLSSNNTSGYRGVSKAHKSEKWVANIMNENIPIYLGTFDYPWTAAMVYDSFVIMNKTKHTINLRRMA